MSKGSTIPALPPKSGCMICGAAHSASGCNIGAVAGLQNTQADINKTERIQRARNAANAPVVVKTPAITLSGAEADAAAIAGMVEALDADNNRRIGHYRATGKASF